MKRFLLNLVLCVQCCLALIWLSPGTAAWAEEQAYFSEQAKQAVRAQASPQQKPYLVDVRSRVIAPGLQKPINFRADREEVYIQFQRPLNASERGKLTRGGIRFYQAIGPHTYLAKVRETALQGLRRHPQIRGIEPVLGPDKLTRSLYLGKVGKHVKNPDGTWSVRVRFYADVKMAEALVVLDALGIHVPDRSHMEYNNRLLVHAMQAQILALAEDLTVKAITEIPAPPEEDNAQAAQISNVNQIQAAPFNLDGTGVRLGIWDSGRVRPTHQDLTNRVIIAEADQPIRRHSTHVGGTMISSGASNANARGMAPAALLVSYDNGDNTANEQANAVANFGIRISNHSWGDPVGWTCPAVGPCTDEGNLHHFGRYNDIAADYDSLVRNTGLIICKSAGNDPGDCNPADATDCDGVLGGDNMRYDTIDNHGNAKNVITVGAINDDGTTIANFSSTGPCDDGRIKPDVVANGVSVTSTCEASDSHYCALSGTSMSTPTVAGTCALLVQRYRQVYDGSSPSPDIIKALLVNTAVDLGRPGPDYLYGHGLVDALAAVQTIDAGPVRIVTEAVDHGQTDEFLLNVPAGLGELRVTLNWIDPEGTDDGGGNTDPDIINNLDLELIAPNGTKFFPFTGPGMNYTNNATATGPNSIDTVEHVRVNPQQGIWKVRVRGTAVPDGPQNYAVVANTAFSLPNQPDIRVNAALDFDDVCPGDKEERRVSIFNVGGADLHVHSVAVVAGGTDFSVLPNPTQPFIVRPGAHVDVTVRFSPASPGAKAGTLRITSNDADEPMLNFAMTGEGAVQKIATAIANGGRYGKVCRGTLKDLDLTIANTGGCDLRVNNITSSSAEFKVPTVATFPLIVQAGTAMHLPIRLEPTSLGMKSANITVTHNDPFQGPKVVMVSGNTPPGDVRVTGSTEFGDVCAGVLAEKRVSICNVGTCNLNVSSVAFTPPCADFTLINNPFPAAVSPDFCIDAVVRFTPTTCGPKSCTLRINTDDPDTPIISLTVTGNTPCASIDVPPDQCFAPTVIQSVGDCSTLRSFPISNTGNCPLTITAVTLGGAYPGDYALVNLPSYPIILERGHVIAGGAFKIAFKPTELARNRPATISVTYVSDPVSGATTTVTRNLNGEGVRTGARVLVLGNGTPVAMVEKIQLQRINANRNKDLLDTVDNALNVPLTTFVPSAPCASFQYHREYSTTSNPIQLLPGSYQVTATAIVSGKRRTKTIGFDVNTCWFNQNIVINLP